MSSRLKWPRDYGLAVATHPVILETVGSSSDPSMLTKQPAVEDSSERHELTSIPRHRIRDDHRDQDAQHQSCPAVRRESQHVRLLRDGSGDVVSHAALRQTARARGSGRIGSPSLATTKQGRLAAGSCARWICHRLQRTKHPFVFSHSAIADPVMLGQGALMPTAATASPPTTRNQAHDDPSGSQRRHRRSAHRAGRGAGHRV
jgi:hypothetical protein